MAKAATRWIVFTMDETLGIYPSKKEALHFVECQYDILTRKRICKGEYEYEHGFEDEGWSGTIWVMTEENALINGVEWSMKEYLVKRETEC